MNQLLVIGIGTALMIIAVILDRPRSVKVRRGGAPSTVSKSIYGL